jgi:3'-5' exoribonuclease
MERKETKEKKPYVRLKVSDGSATAELSVWSDHAAFAVVLSMTKGQCYAMEGTFHAGKYGLESKDWMPRLLSGEEHDAVFAGPPELRIKQANDWAALISLVESLPDSSLRTLAGMLLMGSEEPYRRAGAARGNHHARRGGLVEHVSFMAQTADAICRVYPELRRDLLIVAVIFHDCGKMIENQYEREGFEMPFSFRAEAYGHILIGIEMVRTLWKKLPEEAQKDDLMMHALCHCIAAHHGELEWGSPVQPKLPEAAALHYIDQIDAKLEMFRQAKAIGKELAPGVLDGPRPLPRTILTLPSLLT